MDATTTDPVMRREKGLFAALDKEYNKLRRQAGLLARRSPPITLLRAIR